MFDYVRYSAPCSTCGVVIDSNWQTKDGNCLMDVLEFDPQVIREFYTVCMACGLRNEKRVKVTAFEIVDVPVKL